MNSIIILFSILFNSIQISFALKQKQNEAVTDWRIGQKTSTRGNGAFAENIKCDKNNDQEQLSAVVTLPQGFGTVPVFNEASNVNPSISEDCIIKQTVMGGNKFSVKVLDFDACGVQSQKGADGAVWMSVSLRFPVIGSLRTADDEIITLMCRPQDRIIVRNHVLDLKSQILSPLRTVFSSSPLDFDCNLEVYVKSDDENAFTRMAPNEDVIEIGQEVQLRATIRSGDGWKYAMLKDVTVHKVTPVSVNKNLNIFSSVNSLRQTPPPIVDRQPDSVNSGSGQNKLGSFFSNAVNFKKPSIQRFGAKAEAKREKRQIPDAAFLVLSDGCRNPVFRSIASEHPFQESTRDDNLAVSFNFKAFMFQDMEESGTIRITAKVIACVDEDDCRPIRCIDDNEFGYGKRRKRSPNDSQMSNKSQINDYSRELDLKIVMPRFTSAFVNSEVQPVVNEWFASVDESDCHFAIYLIGFVALIFCFAITTVAYIIIIRAKQTKQFI